MFFFLAYYLWLTKGAWDWVGRRGEASFKILIFCLIFQYFKNELSKRGMKQSGYQIPVPTMFLECFVSQKNMIAILSCVFCMLKNLLAI